VLNNLLKTKLRTNYLKDEERVSAVLKRSTSAIYATMYFNEFEAILS